MRVKHNVSAQVEFGFAQEVTVIVRRAVLRLRRFCKGGWDAEKHEVSYSDWLEFYTPLSSRSDAGTVQAYEDARPGLVAAWFAAFGKRGAL